MTAVRATPRSSPGMLVSLLLESSGWGCSVGQDGGEVVKRDRSPGDDFGARVAQRRGERCGPRVLPDEDRGGGSRFERVCRLAHVVVAEQAARGAFELG